MAGARRRDPLEAFRSTIVTLVRREHRDLTARQLAVFLTCYLKSEPQTVRGLAAELNVDRSAISRVLDRLVGYNLVRRSIDMNDRRSVLVERTVVGEAAIRDLRAAMNADSRKAPATGRGRGRDESDDGQPPGPSSSPAAAEDEQSGRHGSGK